MVVVVVMAGWGGAGGGAPHLDEAFAFPRAASYLVVIKSRAGIRLQRLQSSGEQGGGRGNDTTCLEASPGRFYHLEDKLKAIRRGPCGKRGRLALTSPAINSPHSQPHSSYWFSPNDMHKKVISLSLHCQRWLIRFPRDNQFHISRKCLATDTGRFEWHRHQPAARAGAISPNTRGPEY